VSATLPDYPDNEILTGAALVSGAGSGLGAATARRLAARRLEVLLFDRDLDAATQVAAAIGDRATPYEGDITDEDAVDAAAQAAAELHADGLRVSVACAGIDEAAAILSRRGRLPTELFERIVRVNLFGTFFQLRAAATQMEHNEPIAGERGVHISTASVAWRDGSGRRPRPGPVRNSGLRDLPGQLRHADDGCRST
jgi:NAD(P)-dependent dehydrogenase (short-subunit alcohol dehydrogenase family)